jgi:hypothetical protein
MPLRLRRRTPSAHAEAPQGPPVRGHRRGHCPPKCGGRQARRTVPRGACAHAAPTPPSSIGRRPCAPPPRHTATPVDDEGRTNHLSLPHRVYKTSTLLSPTRAHSPVVRHFRRRQ